jgi:5-methyltetrahydrofolate--homocysteine methyltransferase
MIMEASGFTVYDLGVDIKPGDFVQEIKDKSPQLVGLSALLSTTMPMMEDTIEAIQQAGLRGLLLIRGGQIELAPMHMQRMRSSALKNQRQFWELTN